MYKCLIALFLMSWCSPSYSVNGIFDDIRNAGRQEEVVDPNLYNMNLSPEERVELQKQRTLRHEKGLEYYRMAKILVFAQEVLKPKNLAVLGAAALLVFGAWHTTALARDVAYHYLMIPPLAQKTSIKSWGKTFKDFFVSNTVEIAPRNEVILNEKLIYKAAELTQAIIKAAQHDAFFRHYLFYGPPGTGKTMLAMAMAQEAGLDYVYFSAAKLHQYSTEEAVQQLTRLFEYAYSKKLMVIIDEADALFTHREKAPEKSLLLLNALLTYMGTEQSDYIVVALTNRPHMFDAAALSRFGEQVEIGAPGLAERRAMFVQYTQKYFIDFHTINRDKRTFFQTFFTPKPKERLPLTLAPDVLMTETFDELAKNSEGLVGRDISDLMIAVQNTTYGMPDHTVTKALLLIALENKKTQLSRAHTKFEGYSTPDQSG
jgi:ATPase family AAA domain-containing protein 3A/B